MPIPTFEFEDPSKGLPRRPVPVRFACLAANWSPELLAQLATHQEGWGYVLLRVFEFNLNGLHTGVVQQDFYKNLPMPLADEIPLADRLAQLPKNHYVWSDELVWAYSNLIDNTCGREAAWESGTPNIQWNPALGDCYDVVKDCTDLESLVVTEVANNRIRIKDGMWTIDFDGVTSNFKNSIGIRYINYLLTHPHIEFPVVDLELEIKPQPPDALGGGSTEFLSEDRDEIAGEGDRLVYDEVLDKRAMREIVLRLERLKDQIEDQRERGYFESADNLQAELDETAAQFNKDMKKGNKESRDFNNEIEKCRKRVSNAINLSIEDIGSRNSSLGHHLTDFIKTGCQCWYKPPAGTTWFQ